MNKTPDEIKKGLECCSNVNFVCNEECPYYKSLSEGEDCCLKKNADALAYIQQFEATNAELLTKVEQLTAKCHQLERERDAAVDDLKSAAACFACKKLFRVGGDCGGGYRCEGRDFEWLGVKEE